MGHGDEQDMAWGWGSEGHHVSKMTPRLVTNATRWMVLGNTCSPLLMFPSRGTSIRVTLLGSVPMAPPHVIRALGRRD